MNFTTIIVLIFVVSSLMTDVSSVCCPQIEKILYYPVSGTFCNNILGAYHVRFGVCAFQSCADLQDHHSNFFCGKGDCNSFGCNCDDGCIQLDQWSKNQVSTLENQTTVLLQDIFLKKYESLVKELYKDPGHSLYQNSLKLSSKRSIQLEDSPFLERLKKKFGV